MDDILVHLLVKSIKFHMMSIYILSNEYQKLFNKSQNIRLITQIHIVAFKLGHSYCEILMPTNNPVVKTLLIGTSQYGLQFLRIWFNGFSRRKTPSTMWSFKFRKHFPLAICVQGLMCGSAHYHGAKYKNCSSTDLLFYDEYEGYLKSF